MSKNRIHILPDNLVNKIAAGEVVERPASVIKELVENSIDAGATDITLRLENGGINLIEVSDNGCGMNSSDLQLAFKQHATSKIHTEADLESIQSMGFRGEALPSIASIADVSAISNDGDKTYIAQVQNNEVQVLPTDARSQGTTIQVQAIFSKVPARRKFLRSENTEYKYVLDMLLELALAHFTIGFKLIRDSKEVLRLNPSESQAQRIAKLFSKLTDSDLIPLSFDNSDIKISGFVGHPRVARQDKTQQYIFLNGRPIKDKLVSKAVSNACARHLMVGRQPVYFIYIDITPTLVDVNVHPRKLEVRFVEPSNMFKLVYSTVATALEKHLQAAFKQGFASPKFQNPQPSQSSMHSSVSVDMTEMSQLSAYTNLAQTAQPLFSQSSIEAAIITNPASDAPKSMQSIQVLSTYLIVESVGKLLIIDQHAAAEKIKFEQLEAEYLEQGRISSQPLLISKVLDLTLAEHATAKEYLSTLAKLGFYLEEFSGHSFKLNEIPDLLAETNYEETLVEILHELGQTGGLAENALSKARRNIFATLACHGSIRAGQRMHAEEINQLVSDLLQCKEPYSCPHGRPTIWELNKDELEKKFKRKI